MGYYVNLMDADFRIPNTPEVLDALKALNTRDDLKRGGSYSGGEMTAKWFSWMPEDYDQTCTSVLDVFQMVGFDTLWDEATNEVSLQYYDNKTGQEDLFVAAVAPFVKEGSYLDWKGEDDSRWRHIVKGGRLLVQDAEVTVTYSGGTPVLA